MKLEDPELLRREVVRLAWPPNLTPAYLYKSLYCRNNYHDRCKASSCKCDCHTEASKQLAHHLQEQGAVRVNADGFRRCYTQDCENRVHEENDLFCIQCNRGDTPKVRDQKLLAGMTRPL